MSDTGGGVTGSGLDWETIRRHARSGKRHPDWPKSVQGISLKGLDLLGIDEKNQLYWDGNSIEFRRPLVLTGLQKFVAVLTAIAIILGGIGSAWQGADAGFSFGCKLHWWHERCPK